MKSWLALKRDEASLSAMDCLLALEQAHHWSHVVFFGLNLLPKWVLDILFHSNHIHQYSSPFFRR